MKLIINNSSMQPIYEQICTQIKNKILSGASSLQCMEKEALYPESIKSFAWKKKEKK